MPTIIANPPKEAWLIYTWGGDLYIMRPDSSSEMICEETANLILANPKCAVDSIPFSCLAEASEILRKKIETQEINIPESIARLYVFLVNSSRPPNELKWPTVEELKCDFCDLTLKSNAIEAIKSGWNVINLKIHKDIRIIACPDHSIMARGLLRAAFDVPKYDDEFETREDFLADFELKSARLRKNILDSPDQFDSIVSKNETLFAIEKTKGILYILPMGCVYEVVVKDDAESLKELFLRLA